MSQIMACYLPSPSHCLNQYWLKIIGIRPNVISKERCKICWLNMIQNHINERYAEMMLWIRIANERRRHIVTPFLIGWARTQNDPLLCICQGKWTNSWRQHNDPSLVSEMVKRLTHWPLARVAVIMVMSRVWIQISVYGLISWARRRWTPHKPFPDKSTLVWVMAWCRQATNGQLGQCLPRSLTWYGTAMSYVNNST